MLMVPAPFKVPLITSNPRKIFIFLEATVDNVTAQVGPLKYSDREYI